MGRRKRSSSATCYRNRVTLASLLLSVVVLCLLITANSALQLPFLPTWDSLYSVTGLRDTAPAFGQLKVTVLDVGNADCILLQCNGQTALIDAGENNDEDAIVTTLQRAGVSKLDYVIATHTDADHIGGMDAVIRTLPIDTFLMPFMPEGYTPTTRTYEHMLEAMLDCNVTPIQAEYGAVYALGEATITILSGQSDYTDTNDQSVVCQVSHKEVDFLFMGDVDKKVEREILAAVPTLDVDVLKVGHHGSRSSSDKEFIHSISPDIAIITCGYNNPYKHPHSETLQILKQNAVTVYRSDLNGDIILTSDGETVTAVPEQE